MYDINKLAMQTSTYIKPPGGPRLLRQAPGGGGGGPEGEAQGAAGTRRLPEERGGPERTSNMRLPLTRHFCAEKLHSDLVCRIEFYWLLAMQGFYQHSSGDRLAAPERDDHARGGGAEVIYYLTLLYNMIYYTT